MILPYAAALKDVLRTHLLAPHSLGFGFAGGGAGRREANQAAGSPAAELQLTPALPATRPQERGLQLLDAGEALLVSEGEAGAAPGGQQPPPQQHQQQQPQQQLEPASSDVEMGEAGPTPGGQEDAGMRDAALELPGAAGEAAGVPPRQGEPPGPAAAAAQQEGLWM